MKVPLCGTQDPKDHTYLSFVSPSLCLSNGSLHCVRKRTRFGQDSLLGAFLGLQKLSWKALDPQKPLKTNGVTFALPLIRLRFAFVSPLLYLPFSYSWSKMSVFPGPFHFEWGGSPKLYLQNTEKTIAFQGFRTCRFSVL